MGISFPVLPRFSEPQEAVVLFSPETGHIEEVIVKSTLGAAEYERRRNQLCVQNVKVSDYKDCVIMPGNIVHHLG